MDNTIYAQSIARIRFLETKMIDKSKMDMLVEAKEFSDCIRILQDSPYADYVTMPTYEEGLKKSLEDFYRGMRKISPIQEIIDFLAVRYDSHNIKALVKGKLSNIDVSRLLIDAGTIPADKLNIMIKEESFMDIPKTLRFYIEKAINDYKNFSEPQHIDLTIDKGAFSYMLEIAEKSKADYNVEIAKLLIDISNIKSFIRVKVQNKSRDFFQDVYIKGGNLDIDLFINNMNDSLENFSNRIMHTRYFNWVKEGVENYIKNGDLGSIEKHGDNFIIDYLKKAKLISFGPEPIIAYILAKENEIRSLRIILTGKRNSVAPEAIKERLRDVYV